MNASPPSVRRWLRGFVDALLPPACPTCDGPAGTATTSWICAVCRLRIQPLPSPRCNRCWAPLGTGGRIAPETHGPGPEVGEACTECQRWPPALAKARSATSLEGPARTMVHRLKYHGWEMLARGMALHMVDAARDLGGDWVVPVPTTEWRKRMRGYNQAERIARSVAQLGETPLLDALVRRASGGTQVALQPHERLANVKRAFSLRESCRSRLEGTHVCLVDDVLTTGATAGAAASELRNSGALSVTVLTFARALPTRHAVG